MTESDSQDDAAAALGPLNPVANKCNSGSCPTVYTTGTAGTVVVQGWKVPSQGAGVELSDREGLVAVPLELLREAVDTISDELS